MTTLHPTFTKADVETLSRETSHSAFLRVDTLWLRHRLFAGGWSEPMRREILLKDGAVGVLLFDPATNQLVLIRQFRAGMIDEEGSAWLLELVAGMVQAGEAGAEVAVRESQEEADCTPVDLVRICEYYNSPGTSNEKVSLFCGRVDAGAIGGIHGLEEEHEDIEVVVLSLEEVVAAIASGLINNAMTIIAVQWLQLHKERLLEEWGQS